MSKPTPTNKGLIVIPFWAGDRHAAIELSHLFADIQPEHSNDFDLLFVARFDCPQVDAATVKHVSRKFNTFTHTSKRREQGWPLGCNGTHFGALEFVYHKAKAGQIPDYKFVFCCEADAVPLSLDAFSYLHREWDRISAKQPLSMAGALVPDGGREHLNGGCCLLSRASVQWLVKEVGGIRAKVGWDFGLARDFRNQGWSNIAGIKSFWGTPTCSLAEAQSWAKQGFIWVHGIKDLSLLRHARKMLI